MQPTQEYRGHCRAGGAVGAECVECTQQCGRGPVTLVEHAVADPDHQVPFRGVHVGCLLNQA